MEPMTITTTPTRLLTTYKCVQDETNKWGIAVFFANGCDEETRHDWWFPTSEERNEAAEMWRYIISMTDLFQKCVEKVGKGV